MEKRIIEEIKHRFWDHENRFWINVNFENIEDATARIYFIEREDTLCPHPDCDCFGTPEIEYDNETQVLLEIDNDGLAEELKKHDVVIIHHIGLNEGMRMSKASE